MDKTFQGVADAEKTDGKTLHPILPKRKYLVSYARVMSTIKDAFGVQTFAPM